jgi:hypothetical protein
MSHQESRMDFTSPAELARQAVEDVHDPSAVEVIHSHGPGGVTVRRINDAVEPDPGRHRLTDPDATVYDYPDRPPVRIEYRGPVR